MDKNSNAFTVLFATLVCVVLAMCLAATYNGLKGKMDANARFDKQRNVLIAMGLYQPGADGVGRAALEKLYAERVTRKVLEVKREPVTREVRRGGVDGTETVNQVVDLVEVEGSPAEADALIKEASLQPKPKREHVEIYIGEGDDGQPVYCIPIEGYGLWSTLYGFLAFEQDLDTVRGITFYEHKETPGLGGEVDNPSWQRQWQGKHILDDSGDLVSVTVKKGTVDEKVEYEKEHMVDGLAGATITSNGVSRFVEKDLETYQPYFEKLRKS